MKRHMIIVTALALGTLFANCGASQKLSEKATVDRAKLSYPKGVAETRLELSKENYLKSLRSENDGVVESAVFYVVKFKIFYPGQDCSEIEAELERLASNSREPRIRYKAQLANHYLENEDWLSRIEKLDYKDADQFFAELAADLNSKIFVFEN